MTTVIATPEDVCTCGHLKIWHCYLRESGSGRVSVEECSYNGCDCKEYSAATQKALGADDGRGDD